MRQIAYVAAMLLITLLSCASSDVKTLTLAGSSTIQPLAEVAAEAFERAHPDVRVNVQGGGSGVGVSSVRSGLAELGMVSRALTPAEQDLTAHRIARDGIALIAHASRADAAFTHADVVAMYSGQVSVWPDGQPLTLVTKEEGRSTRELFAEHFGLEGKFRPDLVVIGPNGQAIGTVAADPNALAYVSIGSATRAEAEGMAVRRVPVDGLEPTVQGRGRRAVAARSRPEPGVERPVAGGRAGVRHLPPVRRGVGAGGRPGLRAHRRCSVKSPGRFARRRSPIRATPALRRELLATGRPAEQDERRLGCASRA